MVEMLKTVVVRCIRIEYETIVYSGYGKYIITFQSPTATVEISTDNENKYIPGKEYLLTISEVP